MPNAVPKVINIIIWSFRCAMEGQYPARRHDGTQLNEHRLENRQGPLPFAALLVELRVDWSEAAVGLGFKTWSSATVPCFECTATGETMSCFALDPADQPFRDHTHADYLNEVMKCTVRVHVNSREMLSALQDSLWYDKRKKGSQGRALLRRVAGLHQLEIGDRLEVGLKQQQQLK